MTSQPKPNRLVPCVRCSRHFKSDASACPFCHEPAASSIAGMRPAPRREGRALTRAALLFATAATAACGKTTATPTSEPADASVPIVPVQPDAAEIPTAVPPYGVAPVLPPDGGDQRGAPAYGAPPPPRRDAGACNPPFTIDAKGVRRFKKGCVDDDGF